MTIRRGIKRFKGKSQFSNKAFYEYMCALAKSCVIDPGDESLILQSKYGHSSVIEKMDGTYICFGWDTEFYMKTRSSRRITVLNYAEVWGVNSDLGQAFESLLKDTMLQNALRVASEQHQAQVWFEAELYASLSHKAPDEIRFNVVPYSRSVVGNTGAIVIFRGLRSTKSAPREICGVVDTLVALSHQRVEGWKFFSNNHYAVSNETYTFKLGTAFMHDLLITKNQEFAKKCLATHKRPPEVKAFYDRISTARAYMQDKLDTIADGWRSFLHDDEVENPYVEGVILRVHRDGDTPLEAKGTSKRFDQEKDALWDVRSRINDIVKECRGHTAGTEPSRAAKKVRSCMKSSENPWAAPAQMAVANAGDLAFYADAQQRVDAVLAESSHCVDTKRKDGEAAVRAKDFIDNMHELAQGKRVRPWAFMYSLRKYVSCPAFPYASEADRNPEVPTALVWVGRAQPWHKGHTEMLRMGLQLLDEHNIDVMLVMPVRGEMTQTTPDNPLAEYEQRACMSSTLEALGDDRICLTRFIDNAAPHTIVEAAASYGVILAGWLAGADRCDKYEQSLFDMDKHQVAVKLGGVVPMMLDKFGRPTVKFFETPRVMSGTEARAAVHKMNALEWCTYVTGLPDIKGQTLYKKYKSAYHVIKLRHTAAN